jgi:hypothetical protein
LRISRRVAVKIWEEHGITVRQVRSAVVRVADLDGAWDYDPDRGLRIILQVEIEDETALIVLYPADDLGLGVWRLGSAYFILE